MSMIFPSIYGEDFEKIASGYFQLEMHSLPPQQSTNFELRPNSPVIDADSTTSSISSDDYETIPVLPAEKQEQIRHPLIAVDSFLPMIQILPNLVVNGVHHVRGAVSKDIIQKLRAYNTRIGKLTLKDNAQNINPGAFLHLVKLHNQVAPGPLLPLLHHLRVENPGSSIDQINLCLSPSLETLEIISVEESTSLFVFVDTLGEEVPNLTSLVLGSGVPPSISAAYSRFQCLRQLELVGGSHTLDPNLLHDIGNLPELETFVLDARFFCYPIIPASLAPAQSQSEHDGLLALSRCLIPQGFWPPHDLRSPEPPSFFGSFGTQTEIKGELWENRAEASCSPPHDLFPEPPSLFGSYGAQPEGDIWEKRTEASCSPPRKILPEPPSIFDFVDTRAEQEIDFSEKTVRYQVVENSDLTEENLVTTDKSETSGARILTQSFSRLRKLHVIGNLALIVDLLASINSDAVEDVALTLLWSEVPHSKLPGARKKSLKARELSRRQADEYLNQVKLACSKWARTLQVLHIGRVKDHNVTKAISGADGAPTLTTGTLDSILQLDSMKQLSITGWTMSPANPRFNLAKQLISISQPKISVLRLPIDDMSCVLSFTKLREIAEAWPQLSELGCCIENAVGLPTHPDGMSISTKDVLSHGLRVLSVGNIDPYQPDQLLLITRYLASMFPCLKNIETHVGYNEKQWEDIGKLVKLCQNIILDNAQRM